MTATLPVVYDSGDFLLSSFRDRDGRPAPILETEARIERIVSGLRSCQHVRWVGAAGPEQALEIVGRMHSAEYLRFLAEASARSDGRQIARPAPPQRQPRHSPRNIGRGAQGIS